MKTKVLILSMLSMFSITGGFAQDRTTVTATNTDISDNLDLRAVASIFGDSANLDDFEKRLNDPRAQISNLDLNGDNQVDYLRVIETVEGNTHLIIIQSVLGRNTFQDIATVEVERDRHNRVQVQVVGDVYMYGDNYIYEPVYAYTPVIYTSFWVSHYRPYCSSWYWDYYPSYYYVWSPFPIFTYQNHINICINNYHHYNYVNYRRCGVAYNNYYRGRRGNAYELQHPNHSFSHRNSGYANSYELDNNRRTETSGTRNQLANSGTRNNANTNNIGSPRPVRTNGTKAEASESTPRSYENTRNNESPRTATVQNNGTRNETSQVTPRSYGNTRNVESPRNYGNTRNTESPRNSSPRQYSEQRGNSQRSEGNSKGNRRS